MTTPGGPGKPGRPGTIDKGGKGGEGGRGGEGGAGTPGGPGGEGGAGGSFHEETPTKKRLSVYHGTFILLVVLIPAAGGIGFAEHQRTTDLQKVTAVAHRHAVADDWQLYDAQIAQCRRVQVLRDHLNSVVVNLHQRGVGLDVPIAANVLCTHVIKEPGEPRPGKEPK